MWTWMKSVVIYILLLFRRRSRDSFYAQLTQNCRKRRKWKRTAGITEELDEVSQVPADCRDRTSFTGFSEDGEVVSFRINTIHNAQETADVSLELPGVGRFRYRKTRRLHHGRGKLKLEMLDPMKRWKVSFNGPLERLVSDSCTELVHGSVSLYWQCTADPYDFWTCVSPWQLARNLATQPWPLIFAKLSSRVVWYDQWGELRGTIKIDSYAERFVKFQGPRERRIEDTTQMRSGNTLKHHVIMEGRKLFFTNGCVLDDSQNRLETFGYVTYPVGERWSTQQSSFKLSKEEGLCGFSVQYPLKTKANGIPYTVDRILTRQIGTECNEEGINFAIHVSRFTINENAAYGISNVEVERPEAVCLKPFPTTDVSSAPQETLTIRILNPESKNLQLTGGKGSNLSVLKGLGYNVPDGFCITTAALHAHIQQHVLRKAIESVEATIQAKKITNLPKVCSEAVRLCIATDIPQPIQNAIVDELKNTFGTDFDSKSLAVRSSGLGEDGQETSLAGQMDTFLGARGLDQILNKVKKCWASSLAFQSVEYRRQNGQPVIEPMAVVVQEMVNADVAGVLFTNEPVTGNSCTMVINAAPGLGEIVVSGKADPDTVWISRRSHVDDFEITNRKIGNKPVRLTMSYSKSGLSEIPNEQLANQVCLSDDQIRNICKIGCELENHFDAPQDIEWAIEHGKIYLLQARPITLQSYITEEQLIHEFDTPDGMESSCRTICNIGEMLPGVPTPLTHDYFVGDINLALGNLYTATSGSLVPTYPDKVIGTVSGRPFVDVTSLIACAIDLLVTKNDFESFFFGQTLEEHTIDTLHSYIGRQKSMYETLKGMFMSKVVLPKQQIKQFDEWAKSVDTFTIGENTSSALELYNAIQDKRNVHLDVWHGYFYKMQAVPVAVVMGMLRGKSTSLSTDNCADIATMLANCKNVCSADVPSALAELADAISSSRIKDRFVELESEACHALLMGSDEPIRTKYTNFLNAHGHRCIKEVDFLEKSWAADPRKLIDALKTLIQSGHSLAKQHEMTNAEIVDSLQSPLSWFQKCLIRNVLLDKAKACVAARELGKSVTIKTVDAFKRAYWKLADMMVREGRLPEDDLLFFLTSREIGTLLETRSASLIQKAMMRRRIFPRQEAFRLPKFCFKQMVPLPERTASATTMTSLSVKGMPVGKGVATGRACVLRSLADADKIQKGDILICPFTDVGWSPYFSMIAGLVTEVGGLISHGAVVAREVGIPCVVNVDDATVKFQTGDIVRIDGLKGVLEKCIE